MKPAVRIHNVSKRYRLGELHHSTIGDQIAALFKRGGRQTNGRGRKNPNGRETLDEIWALKDVSLDVSPGEVVGIIGRNGAGKSTLLKLLSRITEPTAGEIELRGRVSSLLEVGTGFHPELTGRDNVYLNGSVLGMKKAEIDRKFDEIVEFSGVEKFLDTPVKRYSSGMQVRLAFAVAAHLEPEILIVDEVLAVGDAEFQRKCIGKMGDVASSGRTVLFVSHNMAAVENLCSRAVVLDRGRVDYDGAPHAAITHYASISKPGDGRIEIDTWQHTQDTGLSLRSIATRNSSGQTVRHFKIGEEIEISFEFVLADSQPQGQLQIGILLEDARGLLIAKCYSQTQSRAPLTLRQKGTVSCTLRDFRVVPGIYFVGAVVQSGHDLVFKQDRVLTFELGQSDVFGTGKLPRGRTGILLPKVRWKCAEATLHRS